MNTTPSDTGLARRFGHPQAAHTVLAAALIAAAALGFAGPAAGDDEVEQSIRAPLAERSLMLDVASAGDRVVAVGERGHILVSSDNGSGWEQVVVPTRALLTGVELIDGMTGVAVGHDSVILRTTDGGATWERVYWAPEDEAPFFDVWFADETNGVALGAYGSHFLTVDGGSTWEFEPLGDTDWHLHEIARADDGTLYVAAEAGFIYRSDDGGATWIELPSPYDGSYFGVLPLEGDTLLIFGLRGHLFRSDDRGENWQEIETGTVAILNRGIQLADGSIVIVGLGGTVLVSSDGGWSFDYFQQAGRRGISAVTETTDGALVLVGEFGLRRATLAELTTPGGEDDR